MKKAITLCVTLFMIVSFAACGQPSPEQQLQDALMNNDVDKALGALGDMLTDGMETTWPAKAPKEVPAFEDYVGDIYSSYDEQSDSWTIYVDATQAAYDAWRAKLVDAGFKGDGERVANDAYILRIKTDSTTTQGAEIEMKIYIDRAAEDTWPAEFSVFPQYNGDGTLESFYLDDEILDDGLVMNRWYVGETEEGWERYKQTLLEAGFTDQYDSNSYFYKIVDGKQYEFGNDETWYDEGVADLYWCIYNQPQQ